MSTQEAAAKETILREPFHGRREYNLPGIPGAVSVVAKPTIPQRYEDTKPVKIQNLTHREILGVGERVNLKLAEKCEQEKQAALKEVEKATWHEAEALKAAAVNAAIEKISEEHKRELRDQIKVSERSIKEESLRTSLLMHRQTKEQLAEQRAAAKRRLQEAVDALQLQAQASLVQAVEDVRLEARERCSKAVHKIREEAAAARATAVMAVAAEKDRALAEVCASGAAEMAAAVQAHEREMALLQHELDDLQAELDAQERRLSDEVNCRLWKLAELKVQVTAATSREMAVLRELWATQLDKQMFIEGPASFPTATNSDGHDLGYGNLDIYTYQICADR